VVGDWEMGGEKRGRRRLAGRKGSWGLGFVGEGGKYIYVWAFLMGRIVPAHCPCRARVGTACWGFGPRTTLRSCRAGTDTKPIVSCRVFVSFSVPPI